MYGVLYNNPYNEHIGEIVKKGQYRNAYEPDNLYPQRLIMGSRMIGGAFIQHENENNYYRPRGGVYINNIPSEYIIPYSIVSYPQYNSVELRDVDRLGSTNHPPTGGKIKIPKTITNDIKKIIKPIMKTKIGKQLLKKGEKIGIDKLNDYVDIEEKIIGEGFD